MTQVASEHRQMVTRRQEVDPSSKLTLPELQRMAQGKHNWRLEVEGCYEGTTLVEVWESWETDPEMTHRMQLREKAARKKAQQQARKWEQERAEYER